MCRNKVNMVNFEFLLTFFNIHIVDTVQTAYKINHSLIFELLYRAVLLPFTRIREGWSSGEWEKSERSSHLKAWEGPGTLWLHWKE